MEVEYHGIRVVEAVDVDGWRIGFYTPSFEEDDPQGGDAYLVAPDGRSCFIAWSIGDPARVVSVGKADEYRFGTYFVVIDRGPVSPSDAQRFVGAILPSIEADWRSTRA